MPAANEAHYPSSPSWPGANALRAVRRAEVPVDGAGGVGRARNRRVGDRKPGVQDLAGPLGSRSVDQPAAERHWVDWHRRYDVVGSSLQRRLAIVQRRVRQALDAQPPGEIRVLSMCAGQGRDLLGVLADHARRDDVRAVLVELDPDLARDAEGAARSAGLGGVRVVVGDAADTGRYEGVVPVGLALVCGVFGNLSDTDVRHTVEQLPRLCQPGATVIWTRHRRSPDLTTTLRSWFADAGFEELGFDGADGFLIGVGTHRLTGPALPYQPGIRLFDFIGDGQAAHQ